MKRAVVIIPTYDERENVRLLVERTVRVGASLPQMDLHMLFVDDGSPDGTADEVTMLAEARPEVHLLQRGSKKGIGTAYTDGFKRALEELRPSIFIQMDADLQHPPDKIVDLVEAVERGWNLVLASRYVRGGGIEGWNWRRRLVSRGANWIARLILGLDLKDLTTGFKAMDREAVEVLLQGGLSSSGFVYQVESTFLIKANGLKVTEVPFLFATRARGTSKLSKKEVWRFLVSVLKLRVRPIPKVKG